MSEAADQFISDHEVKYADVASGTDSGSLTLLDIRRPDELKDTGFIPGSRNLPLQDLDEALSLDPAEFHARYGFAKPQPADQLTITCRSGRRVKLSVPVFTKHGYTNLKLYLGSFLDWQEHGGQVCKM
ncbi:rhodanese domain-containing protein CG4456-like [Pollicipes pollicipes]|uniref:rhodanese domain-containing protein CG4456-like n=1 Tax=Pollicipes pollicipes TaxID=41117 RepID=UPI001885821C|nr:rhodanese domain-containing protein CG4456-like [Pollicipes pollicipes]XP_037089019.1 rhodanese domain-containing protein CG4456-like [Pollicipes pollicipes]XP_037089020.1 rhodanese domain-containing protein CG4456-like [Pollicipes pollicipes]